MKTLQPPIGPSGASMPIWPHTKIVHGYLFYYPQYLCWKINSVVSEQLSHKYKQINVKDFIIGSGISECRWTPSTACGKIANFQ